MCTLLSVMIGWRELSTVMLMVVMAMNAAFDYGID